MLPRPVRNNNPGDMQSGPSWQGLMPRAQMNDAQRSEPRFCVFLNPAYGFRAMVKQLRAYGIMHGAHTVGQVIDRWAPPFENNTALYKKRVALFCGVMVDEVIDLNNDDFMFKLCKAITIEEGPGWGDVWTDAQLLDGLRMAA